MNQSFGFHQKLFPTDTETWFWSYTTFTTNNFRQPEEYSDFPEDGYEQHHQPKFQSLDLEHNLRHTR